MDIDAADQAVEAMRDLVASTADRPGVIGTIGGFGGLFELPSGYDRPVLVASTDGVGTKMAVAVAAGRLETVGIDLVAMCVDDLICCGARPLIFLDYQLLGRVDPVQVRAVMTGIAAGCRQAGCAIVGGELAEHPGLLKPGELDVAGFAVGIVEREQIIDGPARTRPGDLLIGLPSPGLRSNGYSLARHVLLERAGLPLSGPAWDGAGAWTLADELLRPSVVYTPAVVEVLDAGVEVHGIAHITGGGLPGNLPRVLAPGVDAVLDSSRWEEPRIFAEIQRLGSISVPEMERVFNLGVGMVLIVPSGAKNPCLEALSSFGQDARVVGELVAGNRQVHITRSAD